MTVSSGTTVISMFNILPDTLFLGRLYTYGVAWTCVFCSIAVGMKAYANRKETIRMRNSLKKKTYPTADLAQEVYTVMFIDFVSFSTITAQKDWKKRSITFFDEITNIIIKNQGRIDRPLGDGLLAFFGEKKINTSHSVNNAVKAAIEMQELSALQISKSVFKKRGFAMRIGIATGPCHFMNLGGGVKFDYTIAGQTVTDAAYLESSCNPFKINICNKTEALLRKSEYEFIDFNELKLDSSKIGYAATEVDPFYYKNTKLLQHAKLKFYNEVGKNDITNDEKDEIDNIHIVYDNYHYKVLSLNNGNLIVESNHLLACHFKANFKIISKENKISEKLKEMFVDEITLQVRWGQKENDIFVHSMAIKGLNKQLHEFLESLLKTEDKEEVHTA